MEVHAPAMGEEAAAAQRALPHAVDVAELRARAGGQPRGAASDGSASPSASWTCWRAPRESDFPASPAESEELEAASTAAQSSGTSTAQASLLELEAASTATRSSSATSAQQAAAAEEDQGLVDRKRLAFLVQLVVGMDASALEVLSNEELLDILPKRPDGEILSVGSMLHSTARCKPCVLWFRNLCTKGMYCAYCHSAHDGRQKGEDAAFRVNPCGKRGSKVCGQCVQHVMAHQDEPVTVYS
uniref:C3H1-type domain-containing protein n=1 Tax=Pyrodinium bahamense TaxID=73915 RepID=A0A7S0FIT0_9DINO